MALDPQLRAFLDEMAALGLPPYYTLPVEQARAMVAEGSKLIAGPVEPVAAITDLTIPGPAGPIPVRAYRPGGPTPLPVLVYFHGGGWTVCDLDTHDAICRSLANRAGCIVAAVDYHLAPEHKFPAAVEDCFAATEWLAANAREIGGDPERMATGGDSAGGNLATVVALMARDRGGPRLVFQLLVYPVVDYLPATASYEAYAEGYSLTRDAMVWFFGHYLPEGADTRHPHFAPLHAPDLAGLPPALVITAECDVLRDEGEAYAARLRQAGVPVTLTRYEGMIHPFFSMAGIVEQASQACNEAAAALREAFAGRATAR